MKNILTFFLALALIAPGKCTNNGGKGTVADQDGLLRRHGLHQDR